MSAGGGGRGRGGEAWNHDGGEGGRTGVRRGGRQRRRAGRCAAVGESSAEGAVAENAVAAACEKANRQCWGEEAEQALLLLRTCGASATAAAAAAPVCNAAAGIARSPTETHGTCGGNEEEGRHRRLRLHLRRRALVVARTAKHGLGRNEYCRYAAGGAAAAAGAAAAGGAVVVDAAGDAGGGGEGG